MNLKKQLLAKEMKHKMCVFIRYDGLLKTMYLDKKATIKDLLDELCRNTGYPTHNSLLELFSITCNAKLINFLYLKEPALELNQFMTQNSTVSLAKRRKL